MGQYLLAAEADQIQNLLFRSAHLRQVIGGSQLLTRICRRDIYDLLKKALKVRYTPDNVIVSDGGSFRIIFNNREDAVFLGRMLANRYKQVTGSTISVAEPVPFEEGSFQESMRAAAEALRKAKMSGCSPVAIEQFPYMAVCASCGAAPAIEFTKRYENERPNYTCLSCLYKENSIEGDFLGDFRQCVYSCQNNGEQLPPLSFPNSTSDIADLDSKNYVAYLIADGNDMGIWFDRCTNGRQMNVFSRQLSHVLRQSLARPLVELITRHTMEKNDSLLPILPLVLGGDDMFALLPARWAINYALEFCFQYEKEMMNTLKIAGLTAGEEKPTVSAAIVICKEKYPYTLAYQYGKELLKESKQLSKELAFQGIYTSSVNFGVLTGNEIVPQNDDKEFSTFLPYTVGKLERFKGPDLTSLIEQRFNLRSLPAVWRTQLKSLYTQNDKAKLAWDDRLNGILARLAELDCNIGDKLKTALINLGNEDHNLFPHWLNWKGRKFGHALPDLLNAWDYLYDIGKEIADYQEEG